MSGHGEIWGPPFWWACEFPERPTEQGVTKFDVDCRACRIALAAHGFHHPDERRTLTYHGTSTREILAHEAIRIVAAAEDDASLVGAIDAWADRLVKTT